MADLTAAQKRALGEQLRAHRAQLLTDIEMDLRDLGLDAQAEHTREVLDSGDAAVADLLSGLGADQVRRHTLALDEVEQALARLDTGDYGACQSCGERIPYARLAAEPVARRCVSCQARFEQARPRPRGL